MGLFLQVAALFVGWAVIGLIAGSYTLQALGLSIACGAGLFAVGVAAFAAGILGGGDVKLLAALALWLPWQPFLSLIIIMSLVGGVLTLVAGAWHIARRQRDKLEIPYGVAIAAAGLWVLGTTYLPASLANG